MALISTYFAWRRGRGRPKEIEHGWKPSVVAIICIWIFSIGLTCIPLFGLCGHFGYDAVQGRCHMMCSKSRIIMVFGDGLPCLVVLFSYTLVYRSLKRASEDEETRSQRKVVMVLALCYVSFILPHSIFESLPHETPNRAVLNVIFHAWFWCMYAVNFFIYIIFYRRVRKAMQFLVIDLMELAGVKWNPWGSETDPGSDPWWGDLNELRYWCKRN